MLGKSLGTSVGKALGKVVAISLESGVPMLCPPLSPLPPTPKDGSALGRAVGLALALDKLLDSSGGGVIKRDSILSLSSPFIELPDESPGGGVTKRESIFSSFVEFTDGNVFLVPRSDLKASSNVSLNSTLLIGCLSKSSCSLFRL